MLWRKVFEEILRNAPCEGVKPPYFGKMRCFDGLGCFYKQPIQSNRSSRIEPKTASLRMQRAHGRSLQIVLFAQHTRLA